MGEQRNKMKHSIEAYIEAMEVKDLDTMQLIKESENLDEFLIKILPQEQIGELKKNFSAILEIDFMEAKKNI